MVDPFVFPCRDLVKDGTSDFISWYGVNMEVGAKVNVEVEEKEEANEEEGTTEEEEEEACDSE